MMDENAKFIAPNQLEIVRVLPASCQRVWEYLTDPELRKQWFCAGATGQQAGEEFVMDFDHTRLSNNPPPEGMECGDPIVVRGTLLAFEPPHKLAYRWPGDGDDDSIVTIELTPEGENTRLRLVHSQLDNPDFQQSASAGWHAHLDLLSDRLGGLDARDFWVHYGRLKAEYDQRIASSP